MSRKNAHFQNQTTERDFMTWNIQRLVCDLDGSNSYRATVPHYLIRLYTTTDKRSTQKLQMHSKIALNEPYILGTPFTDAQIYSNLGMALSSMRCYNEAFQYLKKAQRLGLNNPSIEQELLWLKNNIGLF